MHKPVFRQASDRRVTSHTLPYQISFRSQVDTVVHAGAHHARWDLQQRRRLQASSAAPLLRRCRRWRTRDKRVEAAPRAIHRSAPRCAPPTTPWSRSIGCRGAAAALATPEAARLERSRVQRLLRGNVRPFPPPPVRGADSSHTVRSQEADQPSGEDSSARCCCQLRRPQRLARTLTSILDEQAPISPPVRRRRAAREVDAWKRGRPLTVLPGPHREVHRTRQPRGWLTISETPRAAATLVGCSERRDISPPQGRPKRREAPCHEPTVRRMAHSRGGEACGRGLTPE